MSANRLLRVALTGGIATGKSYCLARFAGLGAPTLDADVLARQAVAPGTAGHRAVVARFGAGATQPDGSIDRAALARLVFSDADARRALESIVHPVVYGAISRWFEDLDHAGRATVAIADIPLLYESGHERDFAVVIVAACPPALQRRRLLERDGLSPEDADARLASQWPIDEKVKRGNYVIETSGSFEDTNRQVREIWERLTRDATSRP